MRRSPSIGRAVRYALRALPAYMRIAGTTLLHPTVQTQTTYPYRTQIQPTQTTAYSETTYCYSNNLLKNKLASLEWRRFVQVLNKRSAFIPAPLSCSELSFDRARLRRL